MPDLFDTARAPVRVYDTAGRVVFGSASSGPGGGLIFPDQPVLPAMGTMTSFTTYDGSNATCHPSIVDMVALTGTPWNGHRFWCADTPYVDPGYKPPGAPAEQGADWIENPSIWHTDDRTTWTIPAGVTNPLDGPPPAGYFSDPEMVWDPDAERMVYTYRYSDGTIYTRTSTDGKSWPLTGRSHKPDPAVSDSNVSPAIVRLAAGDWRMWNFGNEKAPVMYRATDPTGPWTLVGRTTVNNMPASLWHGDIIAHNGLLLGVGSNRSNHAGHPMISRDGGMTWTVGATQPTLAGYRTTLIVSKDKPGYIESWNGNLGFNRPTWNLTPLSVWTGIA